MTLAKNRLKSSTSTSNESCVRCRSSRSSRYSTSSLFKAANNHSLYDSDSHPHGKTFKAPTVNYQECRIRLFKYRKFNVGHCENVGQSMTLVSLQAMKDPASLPSASRHLNRFVLTFGPSVDSSVIFVLIYFLVLVLVLPIIF